MSRPTHRYEELRDLPVIRTIDGAGFPPEGAELRVETADLRVSTRLEPREAGAAVEHGYVFVSRRFTRGHREVWTDRRYGFSLYPDGSTVWDDLLLEPGGPQMWLEDYYTEQGRAYKKIADDLRKELEGGA